MLNLSLKSSVFISYPIDLIIFVVLCCGRINSSSVAKEPQYIQMVTALVLQLIQCVVHLPSEKNVETVHDKKVFIYICLQYIFQFIECKYL